MLLGLVPSLTDESASEPQEEARGELEGHHRGVAFVLWVHEGDTPGRAQAGVVLATNEDDGAGHLDGCWRCRGVSTTVGDMDTGTLTMPPPDSRLSSRNRSDALSRPRVPLRQPLRDDSSDEDKVEDRCGLGGRFLGAATSALCGLTTTAALGPRREMCSGGTRGGSPAGDRGEDGGVSDPGCFVTAATTLRLAEESSFSLSFNFSPSGDVAVATGRTSSSLVVGSGSLDDCDEDDLPMPESVSEDGHAESLPPSERLRSE